MEEINYSPKEIALFEGVNKLIEEGSSLNNLKVSDIAKAAGIGKGTVYEYFKTKEEVIAKAILYNTAKEIEKLAMNSKEALTFEDKFYSVLDGIIELSNRKFEYIQIFFANKELQETLREFNEDKVKVIEFRDSIMNILQPVIELGIKENIIDKNLEIDYIKSVFVSVLSGVVNIIHFTMEKMNEEDVKILKKRAFTMLTKSLN
ncbi:MAG: TetR/AcrR family transcriptional regulator [Paraclostridium sp.]